MITVSDLKPGDILLYRPKGFIGWAIAWRTFSNWSHVEVYAGGGWAVASRDGVGVAQYPVRFSELGRVIRPYETPNMVRGMDWFHAVADGQKYDWLSILRFMAPHWITRDLDFNRMVCSTCAVRFLRALGIDVVAKDADADIVAPSDIAKTAAGEVFWSDGKP